MPQTAQFPARVQGHALSAAVFTGGCLGALARAGLVRTWPPGAGSWPWDTFAANVVGTAALALFATRLHERLPPSTYRRPLLATGFCGALTTFSTLQIELIRMIRDGHSGLAGGYLAASLATGLLVMFAVTRLVRRARVW